MQQYQQTRMPFNLSRCSGSIEWKKMIYELSKKQIQALNKKFYLNMDADGDYAFNSKTNEMWKTVGGITAISNVAHEVSNYINRVYGAVC